jgi:hypothetical protein
MEVYAIGFREGVVLILSQLAAYHGQIRMCDYLLGNVEHLRRDDQLHQAMRSIDLGPRIITLQAEILELFAGKYNMDVYIFGPSDDISYFLRNIFYDFSDVIMSHQPVGLEKVSHQDRFNIAMKLRERSPADFLATIGLEINEQLLTMTDETGSTVLHWAAVHWTIGYRTGWPSVRLTLYGDLVVSLVKSGSSVSAINSHGHTPLMYLLAGEYSLVDWYFWICPIPHGLHPSQILNSWGTLLNHAGVSLPEYVEMENFLLSRLDMECRVTWRWRGKQLELQRLALDDRTTLTIEVCSTEDYRIYGSQPMPGSFANTIPYLYRLPWRPSSDDDTQGVWRLTETKTLRSSKAFRLSPDSIEDLEFELGRILFGGTQDDHMMLAAIYQREQRRIGRVRDGMVNKRRSSSTPPAAKTFGEYRMMIPQRHSPAGCPVHVHKCLEDVRWGFCRDEFADGLDTRAICIAGCNGRPDNGAHVVAAFLPPADSLMTPRERWLVQNFPWEYGSEADRVA